MALELYRDGGVSAGFFKGRSRVTAGSYFKLARPHFLIPGFMLYTVGYFLALTEGARWNTLTFLVGYAVLGTAHLSLSFSNDYFDFEGDKQSQPTLFSGGSKVLVKNPELRPAAIRIALALLIASFALALAFVLVLGYPLSYPIFATFGALTGFFYSAPPLKFAYRGLSELITALSVGLIMPGFGYLTASQTVGLPLYLFSIPMSCYGLFFILTVEIPDQEADAKAGKPTLVHRLGTKRSLLLATLINSLGSASLLAIQQSQVLAPSIQVSATVFLSIGPPVASLVSMSMAENDNRTRNKIVLLNMTTMLLMLLGACIVFILATR